MVAFNLIAERLEDIKKVVNKVIGRIEKQHPDRKEDVLSAWNKVVGEKAAGHSMPVSIRRKVLIVAIDSSTWMYALNLEKDQILQGIKKELGEDRIKDIRFRMGDIN